MSSISHYFKDDNDIWQSAPLFCYDKERCGGSCIDKNCQCNILTDERIKEQSLKELANFLYELRNRFAHNAQMSLSSLKFEEYSVKSTLADYINYEFRYKRKKFRGTILVKLSALDIKRIIDANFKKLLEDYLDNRLSEVTR
ncbi:MAG: hypothetical protein M1490_05975 [Candidatus Bathyarchaeota archaeon]|nr:hypothetical protein [Candidatus Bathyarchaeota archaeon]